MDLNKVNPQDLCNKFLLITSKHETQFYFVKKLINPNLAGYSVFYQYEAFDSINIANEKIVVLDTVIKELLTLDPQKYTHHYTHHYSRDVSVTYEIL